MVSHERQSIIICMQYCNAFIGPPSDVTYLETFVLACVVTVFGTLMTYAIILTRDQLLIQVKGQPLKSFA